MTESLKGQESGSSLPATMLAAKVPVHQIGLATIDLQPAAAEMARGRTDFGSLTELAESIAKNGLINPIMLSRKGDGRFLLIAGERRLRACLALGWTHIDARIREDMTDLQAKEVELYENLHRKELHWSERCVLMKQIHELERSVKGAPLPGKEGKTGHSVEDTAKLCNTSKSDAQRQIQLAKILEERPDIGKKIRAMPETAALKKAGELLRSEVIEDQIKRGVITASASLKLGSCLDLIREVKDGSVSCVLTDMPFGIPQIAEMEGDSLGTSLTYTSGLKPTDNLDLQAVGKLMVQLIPELARVAEPGAHLWLFFCYEFYADLTAIVRASGLGFDPVPVTWYKGKTTSPFLGYRPAPCSEPILFCWKPDPSHPQGYPRKLAKPCRSMMEFAPPERAGKIHAFQKPQGLLRELIELSTHKGQLVLDPFAGSGATIEAAAAIGRSALGFEIDKDHYNLAQERLTKGGKP